MSSNSLQNLLQNYQVTNSDDHKYISQEFQDYAYRLAMKLSTPEDRETIGMCMRLVKQKPRGLIEQALSYVEDANAKKKVALFLWRLKQLEKEKKEKDAATKEKEPQQNELPW